MYVGIDLGNKRVGFALSQQKIAFPKDIIMRTESISYIRKLLQDNNEIHTIVVGLPYDLYGKDMVQLEKARKFIDKLKEIFPNIDIIGHDERFSSFAADDGGKTHDDAVAAQLILQSYLDSQK